ncbi:MAG TPA: type II secretion system F family protein [Anaerohalosphaeraceae bacterium]|nr:type II secretion system F family protein [Anaerohalosphaeraceae bacterium]
MTPYSANTLERPTRKAGDAHAAGLVREAAQPSKKSTYSRARAGSQELIMFTTQLSVMLDSGVVLSDAIAAISEQMKPGVFRLVVEEIAERLKNGDSFSVALSNYPRIFDTMFVSMVKASEASGRMSHMLDVLAGYLNADADTRKQVKSAMIYPIIMLLMAVAATGSLMFFVLPRFTRIYESRGAALPILTQALVKCSSLLADPMFLATAITFGIMAFFGFSAWKKTPSGQKITDWMMIRTPIFGTMYVDSVLTRSMRILATMVNTGVTLLESIDVMRTSCDNYYFRGMWDSVDARIRDGYQLSDAIIIAPNSHLIAPGIIQMLRAGEKSGQIGRVCDKVSLFLEKKLQNSIRAATTVIEPLMITVMGFVIGTIAIALLLPVFRISSVMAK